LAPPSALLGDDDIREFAKLWQEEFNETLTLDAARCQASLFLELYVVLYRSNAETISSGDIAPCSEPS
jgi:hypothetical protein